MYQHLHKAYRVTVDGKPGRTFTKLATAYMNVLWTAFNHYARSRGFTEPVPGNYLGSLAWRNPTTGALMDLRRA